MNCNPLRGFGLEQTFDEIFRIVRNILPLMFRKCVLSLTNPFLHPGRDGGAVLTVEWWIPVMSESNIIEGIQRVNNMKQIKKTKVFEGRGIEKNENNLTSVDFRPGQTRIC